MGHDRAGWAVCASLVLLVGLTWLPAPFAGQKQVSTAASRPPADVPLGPVAARPAAPPRSGAAEADGTRPTDGVLVVRYRVEVRSDDPAVQDAADVIQAVLEDPRGWQQAAFDFRQDPAATFAVVVAEGEEAQVLCQPYDVGGQFSCQNGPLVVLNAIRWRESVPHWPGDLASYRTMLVNHEVGHLIGMHHLRCTAPGAVAPVMEQQSGSLRGCTANPWPTSTELRLAATHQFQLAPPPLEPTAP